MEVNQSPASNDPLSQISGSSLTRFLEAPPKSVSLARCPARRERRNRKEVWFERWEESPDFDSFGATRTEAQE